MLGCCLKFKKDLKALVGKPLSAANLVETSVFGPETRQTGTMTVVGPSPYVRKWYATIHSQDGIIVSVS